uniref:Uncharacterized protein n=1 Tax=Craspedostauros australis TaxID=1486917 RepID=A0A7R9WP81_9STRA|mmetsp:Transcript_14368/g.39572  ORF Transcript_14368/g.39572 Transcript_14368/m.39572 type:complete len:211 (+) Transcript_14368:370-1002(+)|eukprot:CAMPEP_0198126286 /NCGR_PEP_ID=MMETSP1442-20131203/44446_1 /TAXON_ID= /ORGANISM="Craspedostauros australis, Strain CCMP3328" /LENGTH=210 /DNA_ID=CAMNT_0043786039 /DNA_START=188 /DNA_END=820 /DNA_ORIENTATION=+
MTEGNDEEVGTEGGAGDDDGSLSWDLEPILESACKVTFAGLGGALVGLSKERGADSSRMVSGKVAAGNARVNRSLGVSQVNMPVAWSISCALFVGIIESVHHMSPVTTVVREFQRHQMIPAMDETSATAKSLITLSNYGLGGTLAGLAGSVARNVSLRSAVPRHMVPRARLWSGLVPGLILGVTAGAVQVTVDLANRFAADSDASSGETK